MKTIRILCEHGWRERPAIPIEGTPFALVPEFNERFSITHVPSGRALFPEVFDTEEFVTESDGRRVVAAVMKIIPQKALKAKDDKGFSKHAPRGCRDWLEKIVLTGKYVAPRFLARPKKARKRR